MKSLVRKQHFCNILLENNTAPIHYPDCKVIKLFLPTYQYSEALQFFLQNYIPTIYQLIRQTCILLSWERVQWSWVMYNQGDQIGRIFAPWLVVYFGQFFGI
jgi:hypothetical protein